MKQPTVLAAGAGYHLKAKPPNILATGAGYHLKRKRLVQSRFFL
ncbi:hypothetical protein P4K64_02085 [Bacillus cereus]